MRKRIVTITKVQSNFIEKENLIDGIIVDAKYLKLS